MQAINFRPKVSPQKLREIAKKQHYADLSSFINEAIDEKIHHIHESPKDHKLVSAIKKAVYEYNGWSFSKTSAKEGAAIKKRAADMRSGKIKLTPLSEVIKKLEGGRTILSAHEAPAPYRGSKPLTHKMVQKRRMT